MPEVVAAVLAEPTPLAQLIAGMVHGDPVVAMRATDAAEKVTAEHPEWLAAYKEPLLGSITSSIE